MENIYKRDFSTIFNEIEVFNNENPEYLEFFEEEDQVQQDESIRILGEICQEINSSISTFDHYLTFS